MNGLVLGVFGWLVPGGAHLLMRRYLQFAVFLGIVSVTFAAGVALQGGYSWPAGQDLAGLDGFTAVVFRAGALARMAAGGPYLLAQLSQSPTFLEGRVHEFGTTLLVMAGLFNVLAVSSAFDLRKEGPR